MMWEAQFIIVHKRLERRDLPATQIFKQCEGHHHSDPGQLATRVEECAVILKVLGEAVSHGPWILHLPAQGILKDDFLEHLPLELCHLQMILMKESHHLLQTVV